MLFCVVIQINIRLTLLDDMTQNVFTSYMVLFFNENNGAHCNKGNHIIKRRFGAPTLHTLKGIGKTQHATTQQSKGLINKNYAVFDFGRINKCN